MINDKLFSSVTIPVDDNGSTKLVKFFMVDTQTI